MEVFQAFPPLDFYMVLDLASVLANVLKSTVARCELLAVCKPERLEECLVCIQSEYLWKHGCELYCGLVTKHEIG